MIKVNLPDAFRLVMIEREYNRPPSDTYDGDFWGLYRALETGKRIRAGRGYTIRAELTRNDASAALELAELISDRSIYSDPEDAANRATGRRVAAVLRAAGVEPGYREDRKVVTIHTTVYAPWEEGEDEPRKISEDTDENDVAMWLDPEDEDYATPVAVAVAILTGDIGGANRFYALEPSSYPLSRVNAGRAWWSDEPYSNPYTGEREEKSAHLSGFSEDEAWEIHTRIAAWLREKFHKVIPIGA